jgi:hypothetical protein
MKSKIPHPLCLGISWDIVNTFVIFVILKSWQGIPNTILYDKVCQWQVGGFLRVLRVSSTNKTDRHDKTEILLKVALNTITLTSYPQMISGRFVCCIIKYKYS